MNLKALISVIVVFAAAYFMTFTAIPNFLYFQGKNLYDKQMYLKASEYLKHALVLDPDNTDFRYYYIKTLSELKPTYDIQKTIYEFSQSGNDDGAKILAGELLGDWKSNIKTNIGNNYIEQAPSDSRIIRWNKNSFPLKVYVENFLDLPDYYKSAIARALKQWEKSVDFISFETAVSRSDAQILITFKELPEDICENGFCKYVAGYTSPQITGKTLKKMTITVYNTNPAGEYFSDKEIYNTVLHELGHALGIMGHSYSTGDLMYQQAQKIPSIYLRYREDFHYITGNDINTIELLYMLEPSITDIPPDKNGLIFAPVILGTPEEIAEGKLEEAMDYIKTSPELAAGYINLAGAFADLKDYNKAIDALKKALDLANSDEEIFIIYYNFAYTYLHLKKYDTALKYAELARKIQSTPDVLELISVIEHNKNLEL